jgi:hypothetical protein
VSWFKRKPAPAPAVPIPPAVEERLRTIIREEVDAAALRQHAWKNEKFMNFHDVPIPGGTGLMQVDVDLENVKLPSAFTFVVIAAITAAAVCPSLPAG